MLSPTNTTTKPGPGTPGMLRIKPTITTKMPAVTPDDPFNVMDGALHSSANPMEIAPSSIRSRHLLTCDTKISRILTPPP